MSICHLARCLPIFSLLLFTSSPSIDGYKFLKIAPEFKENQTLAPLLAEGMEMLTTSEPILLANESSSSALPILDQVSSSTTRQLATSTTTTSPVETTPESRHRWVDYRRHQQSIGYPPRMPVIPGIPSGFRNPLATPVVLPAQAATVTPAPMLPVIPQLPAVPPTLSSQFQSLGPPHHQALYGSNNHVVPIASESVLLNGPEEDPFKLPPQQGNPNRRYNITRVEHIVAECSDDYMKVVIRFNGSFTGLVYSSGYVHDPNCIYVNGSGRGYYEFFIRLNQCGTLGRQEMYHPSKPGEARRRDQLMWNTLSIQYNALIEEEFDEIFRLTCEYGSDFWKTVTFPSVNVEVNTGSPVVFTINPPQCQMEVRRGFGIAGTRTAGPVTVGDPLTLLIHMKSEKAGFDILVKNCVAHNGARQRMQLIDANGCVVNDKLISPFRGTYNAETGHQVSLFSYLKAFRFTGSPALYLECDIHMCHNRCPPQRCYWRNLSKRSADDGESDGDRSLKLSSNTSKPILSESLSLYQALEVHHDQDLESTESSASSQASKASRGLEGPTAAADVVCLRPAGLSMILAAFVFLMVVSISSSICYCLQMRSTKHLGRVGPLFAPDHLTLAGSRYSIEASSLKSAASVSDCSRMLTNTPDSYHNRFSRYRS